MALQQAATIVPDQETTAKPGETVRFRHTVTNLSNGQATFKLSAISSLNSTLTFVSATPGVNLTNGNTFTIDNTPGKNTFDFDIEVTLSQKLHKGQIDQITITLSDQQGNVIGGASVRDTITISTAPLYLPLVNR